METLHDYVVRVRQMSGRELMSEAGEIAHLLETEPFTGPQLWREWDIVRAEISIRN